MMTTALRTSVLLTALVFCVATSKKPSDKDTRKVELTAPSMKVTATELVTGHDANELRWEQTYKGKVLEVTGVIKSIQREAFSNDPIVTLEGPADELFYDVQCYIADSQLAKALTLKAGDSLTVKGRMKGWSLGPELSPCSL